MDDFIRQEEYEVRKLYIQGLHELIEELKLYSGLRTLLFIREDLFEDVKTRIGKMKVDDRTVYLRWTDEEMLSFIITRFLFNGNFSEYKKCFSDIIFKNEKKVTSFIYKFKYWFNQKLTEKDFSHLLKKEIFYFIYPPILEINNVSIEFDEYIKYNLTDSKSESLNPRILIKFFNTLNEEQFKCFLKNKLIFETQKRGVATTTGVYKTLNIYDLNCIKKSILITKKIFIENIKSSFVEEELDFNELFEHFHENFKSEKQISENDIFRILKKNYPDIKIDKINFFIRHLISVGYFSKKGKSYIKTELCIF